jgi:polyphosphate kinase
VTAVVELKARFDEERNIKWADTLEEEGLHVVYGLIGMKIHAKLCLILRRESDGIMRYVHIGTGNYNPSTAKTYTDLGLFTSNEEICADVTDLFNHMTGFARNNSYRKLLVSPLSTRAGIVSRIDREIQIHQERGGGKIFFKINHLVDQACIEALYRASRAGVEIRLQVRGICCLRPGLEGVSENITVTSLVGRFLEHARIYWFGNGGGSGEMFIGSADLMPRNLDRRVEVLTPVLDAAVRKTILEDIMLTHMRDNVKSRTLKSDGSYEKATRRSGEPAINSQQVMMKRECGWNPLLTFDGDIPEVHAAHAEKKPKLMKPKNAKPKKKDA